MAYKQNNPLSRKSSSPLFRKQGISPLNSRRMDKQAKEIAYPNAPSRRSSSPINYYPTSGSTAGSMEEAYAASPLKPWEKYVDLNPEAEEGEVRFDAVADLDKIYGGLNVEGDTSKLMSRVGIPGWKPNLTNRFSEKSLMQNDEGDINHPFGFMNTGYQLMDDGSFNMSPYGSRVFGTGNRAFPSSERGYSTESDLTSGFNENLMYTDRPNFNPYTQSEQDYMNRFNIDSSARGGRGLFKSWQTPTGYSLEGIRTPYHSKKGPKDIYANTLNQSFRPGENPIIGLGDFRNQFWDLSTGGRGEFSSPSDNAAINKVEIPNALSLYSNIDPNLLYTGGPSGDNFGYSEQFQRDYPSWLAGGLSLDQGRFGRGSRPDHYDASTNLFGEGAYTSSRFQPGRVAGNKGAIEVDNPMTVAAEMLRSGEWDLKQYRAYENLIKERYPRGNVAGQTMPK